MYHLQKKSIPLGVPITGTFFVSSTPGSISPLGIRFDDPMPQLIPPPPSHPLRNMPPQHYPPESSGYVDGVLGVGGPARGGTLTPPPPPGRADFGIRIFTPLLSQYLRRFIIASACSQCKGRFVQLTQPAAFFQEMPRIPCTVHATTHGEF